MAALLLAVGCGKGAGGNEASANATAPEAASNGIAIVGPVTPQPPDLSGARSLIDTIYTPYTREQISDTSRYYTPELNAAIDRAGEGAIEADPLCECQDFTHFTYRVQSLAPVAGGAKAEVAITNFGESNLITLHLVQRGGNWLIADIGEGANRLTQTLRR
jgi:hypothetical protein